MNTDDRARYERDRLKYTLERKRKELVEAKAAMFDELVEALRNLAKISDDLREEHDEPLCDALERADALLAKAKEIQNGR